MKPEELIHAMAERSRKKLRIAAILPGGIYSYLAMQKRTIMEDGGPEIENPLLVGGNPNVGPAEYYDHVPVARSSELSTVKYNMARVVGTYVISEQEVDENQGAAKIVDIASTKMKALDIAIKKYQRVRAAGTNSGKHPLGMGNLLPTVNNSGTIGQQNLALSEAFRHSVYEFEGTLTIDNIEDTFDDILLDLNNDEGAITVIFAGRKIFNMHRSAAKDKVQTNLAAGGFAKNAANLGLTTTTHQQIPIIYDEYLDPDVAYFVNENEMAMHILKSANMKMKDLTAPYDQDVIGKRFIHEHQLCSWKQYRTHGFVSNKAA